MSLPACMYIGNMLRLQAGPEEVPFRLAPASLPLPAHDLPSIPGLCIVV